MKQVKVVFSNRELLDPDIHTLPDLANANNGSRGLNAERRKWAPACRASSGAETSLAAAVQGLKAATVDCIHSSYMLT